MIVTNNTFVSYSMARGSVQFQLILLTVSLYTIIAVPDDAITQEDLQPGLSLEQFNFYTKVLFPTLIAANLLINVLTDYLGFESIEYPAAIMGLCSQFALFSLVVRCEIYIILKDASTYAYYYGYIYLLEVNLIGQIVSGVIFMMLRGCIRPKVQLRSIPETKCVPETDALTVYKDEINLHTSFFIPCAFAQTIHGLKTLNLENFWLIDILYWT